MSIRSKLITTYVITTVALVFICLLFQQSLKQVAEAKHWIEHTQIVIEKLESVMSLCKDLETGQRGFALTQKENMLEPYTTALIKIPTATAEIQSLTTDNANQQKRIGQLEDLEARIITFSQKVVESARKSGMAQSAGIVSSEEGKKTMDQIRSLISEMQSEERQLLQQRTSNADELLNGVFNSTIWGAALAFLLISGGKLAVLKAFTKSIRNLQDGLDHVGHGNLDHSIPANNHDEFDKIANAFNDMTRKLKASIKESTDQAWLNSGLANLGQILQGEREPEKAAQKVLSEFATTVGTRHGLFYYRDGKSIDLDLNLLATYAHTAQDGQSREAAASMITQCAIERKRIVVADVPENYFRISSGSGEATPKCVAFFPVIFEGQLKAVIEQSSFTPFTPMQLRYLDQAADNIAIFLNNMEISQHTAKLLQQEQLLTEELQAQQEELSEGNRRLESLAASLQSSEEELRQQQEELQQTNEELEERSTAQQKQFSELVQKNFELEEMRQSLQVKASQLSQTSRYKSEFLSNMSHELRTPLNSLLILSKVLFENADGNLTSKQIEFAKTIHSAGTDLLNLIDDVLDISKIEAGAMPLEILDEPLKEICSALISNFEAVARSKGLELRMNIDQKLPHFVKTDGRRLLQILRNIIANALKFTEKGSVTLTVSQVDRPPSQEQNSFDHEKRPMIAFAVQDTGIGIAEEKQRLIFEAFQQADGTTNRRFGGTGLGLAISKELAALLGGEITLESQLERGSTFTLYLPTAHEKIPAAKPQARLNTNKPEDLTKQETEPSQEPEPILDDDRMQLSVSDRVLLVLQKDSEFLSRLIARAHSFNFKVISATSSKNALAFLNRMQPTAIAVDVGLPDKEGWIFIDRLKRNKTTRHIPVHVISDQPLPDQARRLGAAGCVAKAASGKDFEKMIEQIEHLVKHERRLLIVEDNKQEIEHLRSLLSGNDLEITAVESGGSALQALAEKRFDCMVLDLGLSDISGFDLLAKMHENPSLIDLPVIVHTGKSITAQEELELRRNAQTIVIKGTKSDERLLDETSLFLHRLEANLPDTKRKMLEKIHQKDSILSDKQVLVVDDDMRHLFAMTSLLERYEMKISHAENGAQALEHLEKNPNIDIVLMDVMMPEMDGLETIRRIRSQLPLKHVPIIALTAKAMKGDREQCIAAGASDYLAKPVDSDQLLSLMRVWLYQKNE